VAGYVEELRVQWRPVTAALIGTATGLSLVAYVVAIMGPHLIAEFGWNRADFALVGALGLSSVLVFPVVGRLTDTYGVRRTALVGVVATPLTCLAYTLVDDIRVYAAIFALQCISLVTTTAPVYCRVIVQYINHARGLALAIAACGPALAAAVAGPLLNNFVTDHGWRAGYVVLAVATAISGAVAILLLPSERARAAAGESPPPAADRKPAAARKDFALIFRSRPFWILCCGVLLCTLPQAVLLNQLNLVLGENGVTGKDASMMISGYAVGTVLGRILSGLALDRFHAPLVATVVLALSGSGLLLIASSVDAPAFLLMAVLMVGLGYGAESDVIAYLIIRNFGLRIYSSVYGLVSATVAISATLGAIMLSVALNMTGAFAPFLTSVGGLVLLGSLLFLFLPGNPEDAGAVGGEALEGEDAMAAPERAIGDPAGGPATAGSGLRTA
jgi:MFS family permease